MATDTETLLTQSNKLFEQVMPLRSFQQELAEHFYVERADFTTSMNMGKDFASHLTTSYPLTVRRDLANIFSTMLRPQEKVWAVMTTRNYDDLDEDGKRWLEQGTHILRNAMYDQDSGFSRATSQADDDIAVFGNAVISCEMNWRKRALLFRNWHLRDCVWCEDADGSVGRVDRRWKPYLYQLNDIFKGNISPKLKEVLAKEPYREVEVRHIFVPVEEYDSGKGYARKGAKYVSVFYECENKHVLEEIPYKHKYYAVPRWKTLSGSQYGYSPAATTAIGDARLIQDAFLTLLEAGQKAVDPPMLAMEDVLRSDANLFAGGITTIDSEDYDESRMGKPLYPVMDQRSSSIPIGMEILQGVQNAVRDAFFLTKIGLPQMGSGMSQMEISQRVTEYVRGAIPLFSPLTDEYNGAISSLATDVLFANGGFGPTEEIPDSLLGKNIEFKFNNPLLEAQDKIKSNQLLEAAAVLNQLAAYDPSVPAILDPQVAARDVIDGIGAPRKWFRKPEEVQAITEQQQAEEQAAKTMLAVQQGAVTAEQIGTAGQALQGIQQ